MGWTYNALMRALVPLVKRHLQESDLPLAEVADLLGFAGLSSFSHWFQNQFGCSASHWRRQNTGLAL